MNDFEKFGPKLTEAGNQNPYKVPDGYFDSLPSRVQDFCKEQTANNQPVKWGFAFKTQLSLAAGLCFFVLLAYTGYYYSRQSSNYTPYERVDYMNIVVESGTEFDETQLYDAFLNGNKKDTLKNASKDELIEYLLNYNFDNGTPNNHTKDIKP